MKKYQIVYVVFGGRKEFINEAKFSAVSAYARLKSNRTEILFTVCTDTPEDFSDISFLNVETISTDTFKEYFGKDNYIYRTKPIVLQKVLQNAEKSILIDTDTIFKESPEVLFELVSKDCVLVDDKCAVWTAKLSRPLDKYLKEVFHLRKNMDLVNSGLIGLVREDAHILEKTTRMIDELYKPSDGQRTIEQFALAVVIKLENYKITENADKYVKHYWSRKHIYQAMGNHWLEKFAGKLESEEALIEIKTVPVTLPKLPLLEKAKVKLKAKAQPKEYRQFFKELHKALYPYKNEYFRAACNVALEKAFENLKEKKSENLVEVKKIFKELVDQYCHVNSDLSKDKMMDIEF